MIQSIHVIDLETYPLCGGRNALYLIDEVRSINADPKVPKDLIEITGAHDSDGVEPNGPLIPCR